ncbi:MAG TPA: hypothetical protein VHX65_03945 [Pirellulales bacterium]|nr:hypothetical protein [Pirellulales bacterium]
MKRLLAFVVIASLGVVTVGCDSGKTEKKAETSTSTSGPNGTAEHKTTTETTVKPENNGGSTKETTTKETTKTPGDKTETTTPSTNK